MKMISKLKKRKEILIGLLILFIPLLMSIPVQKEFIANGDIVHVNELNIDGNVYFTYVESGYVTNLLERLQMYFFYEGDVEFYDIDPDVLDLYEEDEYWEEVKEASITAAVELTHEDLHPLNIDDPLSRKIDLILNNTIDYLGDSFGLMVAIGLFEEQHQIDFSRRNKYKIAGTGTIEPDGTVFTIGGLKQKLRTAAANQVDYFFIPKDRDYYWDEEFSNEAELERILEEEPFDFEIVPVSSLYEAVEFLSYLE